MVYNCSVQLVQYCYANLMWFVRKEPCIDPLGVEISLVLHPLSFRCRLLRWSVVVPSWLARRCRVCLVVIGQLWEDVSARLAVLVPWIPVGRRYYVHCLIVMQTPQDLNPEGRVLLTDALSIQFWLWCNLLNSIHMQEHWHDTTLLSFELESDW